MFKNLNLKFHAMPYHAIRHFPTGSFAVQFGDHLRSGIICGAVQSQQTYECETWRMTVGDEKRFLVLRTKLIWKMLTNLYFSLFFGNWKNRWSWSQNCNWKPDEKRTDFIEFLANFVKPGTPVTGARLGFLCIGVGLGRTSILLGTPSKKRPELKSFTTLHAATRLRSLHCH